MEYATRPSIEEKGKAGEAAFRSHMNATGVPYLWVEQESARPALLQLYNGRRPDALLRTDGDVILADAKNKKIGRDRDGEYVTLDKMDATRLLVTEQLLGKPVLLAYKDGSKWHARYLSEALHDPETEIRYRKDDGTPYYALRLHSFEPLESYLSKSAVPSIEARSATAGEMQRRLFE